jgi:hypothetical protein
MLLPTDECFAQEVPEHVYDGLTCPSDQWILRHVLKLQPRRTKHHAKRVRRCRSANSGRLMTLLDLSPDDFRRFLTVLVDRRLLGSQNVFILSKHGMKANIRSTQMANNRHACNMDVLQS